MGSQGNLQAPLRKRRNNWCAALLVAIVAIAGCSGEDAQPGQRANGPVASVQRLAEHLRHNDLRGFARDAVPPEHFEALEAQWRDGSSRWPLTELPLDEQVEPMLSALAAPDAVRDLTQSFDRNLANQGRDLRQAAQSLGAFGVQYVQREGVYSPQERAHYVQVIRALSAWAREAPLGDPARADAAIAKLAAAARTAGFTGEASLQEAGMEDSLVRLQPFFAVAKNVLASYGLLIDRSLDGLRAELVAEQGEAAQVRVRYPLAGREVDMVLDLARHDGRWYLAEHLREGEQALQAQRSALQVPPPRQDVPAQGELPPTPPVSATE